MLTCSSGQSGGKPPQSKIPRGSSLPCREVRYCRIRRSILPDSGPLLSLCPGRRRWRQPG